MEDSKTGYAIVCIIIGIIIGSSFGPSRGEIENIKEEMYVAQGRCEDVKTEYVSALEEANSNIDEANDVIYDANGYAWSSYQEMGEALENLSDVSNIDDPDVYCY